MDAQPGCRRFLFTCGCLIVVGGLLLSLCGPVVLIGVAGLVHDEAPDFYNDVLSRWLGIGCNLSYALSEEDAAKLSEKGFDPKDVANAIGASKWCASAFGGNIDIGIQLAIYEGESGYGTCDGFKGIERRWGSSDQGKEEKKAADWLLDYWQENNVRARNPIAAAYIYSDYSGYKGGCSAGEMGRGQFIPTTAIKVCQNGLSKGDGELKSCDFWSTRVTFHAIAYWLDAIGYKANLSFEEKVKELVGWNTEYSYRVWLVTRAEAINGLVGNVSANASSSPFPQTEEFGKSPLGSLRLLIILILDTLGILPEGGPTLSMPLRAEDLERSKYPGGISQDWMDRRYDREGHPGIDWAVLCDSPVFAAADGIVMTPSPGTLMWALSEGPNHPFGNNVWIEHPFGLWTIYAHLNEELVSPGQIVKLGQQIGTVGSTGHSTGCHLHFGVTNIHPDKISFYHEIDPGWVNPHDYLEKCGPLP